MEDNHKKNQIRKTINWIIIFVVFVYIVIVSIMTTVSQRSQQPNITVTGVVIDALSGKPIVGAVVSDADYGKVPHKSAVTDSVGYYSYQTWGEEHNIVARADDFESSIKTLPSDVTFQEENIAILNFMLIRE